MLNPVLNQCWD